MKSQVTKNVFEMKYAIMVLKRIKQYKAELKKAILNNNGYKMAMYTSLIQLNLDFIY